MDKIAEPFANDLLTGVSKGLCPRLVYLDKAMDNPNTPLMDRAAFR